MKFRDQLIELEACRPATDWVGGKSLSKAWATCKQGDWLLWLAARVGVDRKKVVLAVCDCTNLAYKHLSDKVWRSGSTGSASAATCAAASDVARSVNLVIVAASDATAAIAASHAVVSAAIAAAHFAADTEAYLAARAEILEKCAAIVRMHISAEMISEAMGGGRDEI